MISCTEFIPMYSELFKYIEEKAGHDAVVRYWKFISSDNIKYSLGRLADEHGVEGCWKYWSHTLNEEAADFVMTYDDETEVYTLDMRHCPSRGLLNGLEHMEPYHDYCGHCALLYAPLLKERGIDGIENYKGVDEARCRVVYYDAKKGLPEEVRAWAEE